MDFSYPTSERNHINGTINLRPDWRFSILLPVALAAFAGLLRYLLEPWLNGRLPFVAMLPVVLASVWYGGLGAGMVAVFLGAAIGDWISMGQLPWTSHAVDHSFALGAYLLSMLIMVFLVDRLRVAQRDILGLNSRLQRAMAETHHRVKNNLQVVSALVEMPMLAGHTTVPADDLRRIGRHVRGLAAIHDLLTDQAKSSGEVEYLGSKQVLGRLVGLFSEMADGRAIQCRADDIQLPARQATALSVVVNELVTNALKHGRGDVGLDFRSENGGCRLDVSDSGDGFPPGFDPNSSKSTGLELVETVATWDLGGTVAFGNGDKGGAKVTVTFPVNELAR